MEDETYSCSSCQKMVPVGNRTMHTLVCGRHEKRPTTISVDEQPVVSSDIANIVPAAFRTPNGAVTMPEPLGASATAVTVDDITTTAAAAQPASVSEFPRASLSGNAVNVNAPPAEETVASTDVEPAPAAGPSNEDTATMLVECEYCELPVTVVLLDDHSRQCGGRTDVCDKCLNYVRLRDMRRHKDSNCHIASTGSAMNAALDSESEPLLAAPAQQDPESPWSTPVAYAVGAAAAAAAMSLLIRRR